MSEGEQMESGPEERGDVNRPEGLWRFAVDTYAQPGVQDACLVAQDEHGVDVNLLLFSLWAAARNRRLDRPGIERADQRCSAWRRNVILPLRTQRRRWKADSSRVTEYAAIQSLELQAERTQLSWLDAMLNDISTVCGNHSTSGLDSPSLTQENLAAVLRYFGVSTEKLELVLFALACLALGVA